MAFEKSRRERDKKKKKQEKIERKRAKGSDDKDFDVAEENDEGLFGPPEPASEEEGEGEETAEPPVA